MTTGLYPSELLLGLEAPRQLMEIKFLTTGARKINIEGFIQTNA